MKSSANYSGAFLYADGTVGKRIQFHRMKVIIIHGPLGVRKENSAPTISGRSRE